MLSSALYIHGISWTGVSEGLSRELSGENPRSEAERTNARRRHDRKKSP